MFIVYNAYPVKAKQKTWEKRVVCVSWLFGCYKTMKQQVDGRSDPLLWDKLSLLSICLFLQDSHGVLVHLSSQGLLCGK